MLSAASLPLHIAPRGPIGRFMWEKYNGMELQNEQRTATTSNMQHDAPQSLLFANQN